jgi:hypothetical protein
MQVCKIKYSTYPTLSPILRKKKIRSILLIKKFLDNFIVFLHNFLYIFIFAFYIIRIITERSLNFSVLLVLNRPKRWWKIPFNFWFEKQAKIISHIFRFIKFDFLTTIFIKISLFFIEKWNINTQIHNYRIFQQQKLTKLEIHLTTWTFECCFFSYMSSVDDISIACSENITWHIKL